jgi:hypothetical protein
MLSVLLRLTDSDYPFGMFKLFLHSVDLGSGSNINRRIASLAKVVVFQDTPFFSKMNTTI